jgi:hypothetical protein
MENSAFVFLGLKKSQTDCWKEGEFWNLSMIFVLLLLLLEREREREYLLCVRIWTDDARVDAPIYQRAFV